MSFWQQSRSRKPSLGSYNARMATFIDDQGGTGWTPGSHTHFRLAAAWIPTANVSPFKAGVRSLRQEFGLRVDYEFKFSKTHHRPDLRTSFFNLALELGLHFTACSFDKRRIQPGSVDPFIFHQVCAVSLAVHLRSTYLEAEAARCAENRRAILLCEPILVDDKKDAAMLDAIEQAFRALRSARDPDAILTTKPKFRDSVKDETVQLADMVMGAVGAHLDGDSAWFNEIRRGGWNLGVVQLARCQSFPRSFDLSESV
jgi:Protein of unknown function (DUF3800)